MAVAVEIPLTVTGVAESDPGPRPSWPSALLPQHWTLRSEMSEKLRSKRASLSPAQLAELRREVLEELGAYASEGGVSFPGEVLIVSGTRTEKLD